MKKALAALFLTSLLLHLWFAISYWSEKPLTHDAKEYLELAGNFNKTGHFVYESRHQGIENYGRAPGYPFWLAMLLRIESTMAWIRLAEVLVSLFSTYLFFLIGRELFSVRTGLIAFVLSSFYAPFFWLMPAILSENLWIALILLSYWFLLRGRRAPLPNFITAFLILALATLVRPAALFLLPFYCWWTYRQSKCRHAAALSALYFLALLPWNYYLYHAEGRFIFVASEGWVTLWTGTHPLYSGDGDLAVNPQVQKEYRNLLSSSSGKTAAHGEKIYVRLALENVKQNPWNYMKIEAKKFLFWFVPFGSSILKMSLLHRISSILFYFPILILSILGFRSLAIESRYFVLGVLASFTGMILIFFPQERFRIATMDPVLLLISSQELLRRSTFFTFRQN